MAKITNLMTLILMCIAAGSLVICASSSKGKFVLHGFYDMQVREDTRDILNKHGFDEQVLKYYWRRAMLENAPARLAPGGPDSHHH